MSRKKSAAAKKPPEAQPMLVLLERIEAQNKATIEAVWALGGELRAEIRELERRLTLRIEALEAAVRQNSSDIAELKSDVKQLRVDVDGLRSDVDGLRSDVDGLRSDVDGLRSDVDGLRSDLNRLADVVNQKPTRADYEALEKRVAEVERRLGL